MLSALFSFWGLCLLLCVLLGPFAWALSAYQSYQFTKWIKAKEAAAEARRLEIYRANN